MQYGEVVQTVNNLVPEMARTGDPEGVLLKYARDNSLAPAVLERMGNAFNLGTALQGMLGPDRGASVPLLDLEAMGQKYAAWAPPAEAPKMVEPTTKQARAVPDLVSGLTKAAVAWEDPDDLPKAAAARDVRMELAGEYEDQEQDLTEIQHDLCKSAAEVMRALGAAGYVEREHRQNMFNVSLAEADGIRKHGEMAKYAFDWFEQYARQAWEAGCVRATDYDVQFHKLAHDWSGCAPAVYDLIDTFGRTVQWRDQRYDLLKRAADEGMNEDEINELLQTLGPTLPPRPRRKRHFPPDPPVTGTTGKRPPPPPPGQAGATPERGQQQGAGPSGATPAAGSTGQGAGPSGQTRPPAQELLLGVERIPQPKGKGEDVDYHIDDTVTKILGILGKPTDVAQGRVQKWLTEPTKNRKQVKVDQGVQNVEQTHALQTLMLTDPVISKADPAQVAEIYETIRRGSSDVATDKNLLRFQLREALQYGGVPPDGYKQLLEIAKLRGVSDKNTRDESKLRYNA